MERIRALWPDEPLIERRAAELAARGEAEALLAIEYSELRPQGKGSGLTYSILTRDRWHCSGYDLAECEEEVRARRPKRRAHIQPTVHIQQPESPPVPPTREEIQAAIETANHRVIGRMSQKIIREWCERGLIPEDLIPSATAAAEKKTGCGVSRQSPPQPTEVHSKCSPAPVNEHTVKVCPRQGNWKNTSDGQRARQDSNLQPSDSKFCFSVPDLTPSSVTSYDPGPPGKPPD